MFLRERENEDLFWNSQGKEKRWTASEVIAMIENSRHGRIRRE